MGQTCKSQEKNMANLAWGVSEGSAKAVAVRLASKDEKSAFTRQMREGHSRQGTACSGQRHVCSWQEVQVQLGSEVY